MKKRRKQKSRRHTEAGGGERGMGVLRKEKKKNSTVSGREKGKIANQQGGMKEGGEKVKQTGGGEKKDCLGTKIHQERGGEENSEEGDVRGVKKKPRSKTVYHSLGKKRGEKPPNKKDGVQTVGKKRGNPAGEKLPLEDY